MNDHKAHTQDHPWLRKSETLALAFVFTLAGLSFAGWLWSADSLVAPLSVAVPINPLTAIYFILLSLSILVWRSFAALRRAITSIVVLLSIVIIYILLDKLFRLPWHIDLLFFVSEMRNYNGHLVLKGMSLPTCICFLTTLLSMQMIQAKTQRVKLREALNLFVLFTSLAVLVFYLFRVPEYGPFYLMAPLTAILFILLSAALLLMQATQGLLKNIFTGYFSESSLRYFVPLSLAFPIALGYVRLSGEWNHFLSNELGIALIVLAFMLVLTGSTVYLARVINQREKLTRDYQIQAGDLAAANEELRSVTEELQSTNEELSSNVESLSLSNRALEYANATIAKQKDEQLNRVLDSANDVIWAFDLTGEGESYLSRSAERIFQRPYEQLIKEPYFWQEFVHDEDKGILEQTEQLLNDTGECLLTYRIVVNGELRWVRQRLKLVKTSTGNPVRLEGVMSDITEARLKETEVTRERNLLRTLIDNIPSYIFLRDINLNTILANRASFQLLGAKNESGVVGRNLIDYYGESARKLFEEEKSVVTTGEPLLNRVVKVSAHGKQVLLSTTKIPIKDENGRVIQVLGISHDITELRNREAELERYKAELELVFNNSSDIFYLLDREFKLLLFNKRFSELTQKITGNTATPGRAIGEMYSHHADPGGDYYQLAIAGESSEKMNTITIDGADRTYRTNYRPVFVNGVVEYVSVFSVDVTETVQLQNIIEIIFKNTNDIFLLISDEKKVVRFNKAFEDFAKNILGMEPTIGSDFMSVVAPERKSIADDLYTKALAGTRSVVEAEFTQSEGSKIFHHVRYEPIVTEGRISHVFISAVDVTAFKEIEANLIRGQYFLDRASESARIGYWTSELDKSNGKLSWSKEVFRIFGVPPEHFTGTNKEFFDRVHPDDREEVLAHALAARERGSVYDIDHRIVLPDGSVRWVNEKAQILREKNNPPLMVGVVQDINERKLVEAMLREYNERFEILSRATNDAIWDWDLTNDQVQWNQGITSIFGYDETRIRQFSQREEKVHPDDRERVSREIADTFKHRASHWSSEYRFQSSDQSYRHVLDRAFVIYIDGKAARMIGAMQDVTEITEYRLNLERLIEDRTQKLNQALLKEKELVDIKSKFITIVSHEFRTPLATIALSVGFLKRYKDRLTSEMLDSKVAAIEKQMNHMSALLEDVLFVGKADGGTLAVNLKSNRPELLQELAMEAMEATSKNNHVLDYHTTGTPHEFISDEKLLRNIILNLITNAVKFSPDARLVIMTVDFGSDSIQLTVHDYGIGIPEAEIKKLFTSFSRASNAGNIEGTGLGLVIVKKAVELLGGSVRVWSEMGKGTEFTVTLPRLRVE